MIKQLRVFLFLFVTILSLSQAFGQEEQVEVNGTVSDEKNETLPGVSVSVEGTTKGVSTDINGAFKITAPSKATLVFSYLGYQTVKMPVPQGGTLTIKMVEEVKQLGDVVVIGYGTSKKKDLTGSITSISSKDFQKGVIVSPEQLIAGKAAGIQITNNGGAPGEGSTIRIRGASSLSASNDPLIVIDGVPTSGGGVSGSPNALSLINPNDIENMTILKDASAAAIYGSRAANGVIIITTKKGAAGSKPSFTINSQNSIAMIPKYVDVLTGPELWQVVKKNGTPAQRGYITDTTRNTNWQKEIYQIARTFDQNVSYGGSVKWLNNMPFRISGGYLNQTGVLKTDKMQRATGAINITPLFLDGQLKVNLNVKGSYSSNDFANRGAIGTAIGYDPTKPVYDTSKLNARRYRGYYELVDSKGKPLSLSPSNPVGMLYSQTNVSHVYRSIGNITLDYRPKFFPDLTANLNLGFDASRGRGETQVFDSSRIGFPYGSYGKYDQNNRNLLGEFYLRYLKEIKELKSRVDVNVGTSFQDFYTKSNNFRTFAANRKDTIPGVLKPVFPNDIQENRLQSFWGRLIYTFNEKYIFTGTVRIDGSSRFSEENRWGLFPSAAFAWSIKDEDFLKNVTFVSNLKARLSYGATGQQDIGQNYGYLPRYNLGQPNTQYPFGDQFYRMYTPIAYDPNIKWETNITNNAGIDFGFFEQRITGSVDYFVKQTKDLLNTIPVPSGSNFSDQVLTNIGSMENKGLELTLNFIPVQTTDITWEIGFNMTHIKNEITKLREMNDAKFIGNPTGGIGLGRNIQLNAVGGALNTFYVLEQIYDAKGKPIEGAFVDQNNDGIVNDKDFIKRHQSTPINFYGLSTNFTWKNLSFGTVFRANTGNYMFANQFASTGALNNIINSNPFISNGSANYLETQFTGAPVGLNSTNRFFSSYYLREASFIRCDNINIGYNFGKVWRNVNLGANFNIQNAFFITRYKGLDPEIFNGIDNNIYPRPRLFVLGVTANF